MKPSLVVARGSATKSTPAPSQEDLSALRGISPDRLRRRLRGDLDNIILKALEKDPKRRYRTVEQLQEDINRHLENLPVSARTATSWYRTSRFVFRHKAGVALSTALAAALLVGLAVTLYEANVARQQRVRAEHRFNDVRKLANSLLFDIHDSIRDLSGATPARKLLVSRALEYLDSLSKESAGDISLQRELAAAYDRVGDLLGYSGAANLGDFSGAIQSYEKALAIRESAAKSNPKDVSLQSELLGDYFRVSFALFNRGEYSQALKYLRSGLPIAEKPLHAPRLIRGILTLWPASIGRPEPFRTAGETSQALQKVSSRLCWSGSRPRARWTQTQRSSNAPRRRLHGSGDSLARPRRSEICG